ncbi:TraY domain-containing protein [Sphingomonas gei]|uniref:Relaxosome protein TraY n=1 Tax=Sphingomonas gei TaxID=1395960 RepID=A0A4S1XB90_9SPHN|nr:TraY domain-containing protein [Sphingomonas gei]TGX53604.1 TraY domain-containing protein [Sphingomonas gei]
MLAVRLDAETEARLDALAARTGRTKTFYAREAILAHLDDLEDFYLAKERLRSFRNGQDIPLVEGQPSRVEVERADMLDSLRKLWAQGEASGAAIDGNFDAGDIARRGSERMAAARRRD